MSIFFNLIIKNDNLIVIKYFLVVKMGRVGLDQTFKARINFIGPLSDPTHIYLSPTRPLSGH